MTHASRSILTRSPCVSLSHRITSNIPYATLRNANSRFSASVLCASAADPVSNSFRIRSYEKRTRKSFRIRSYKIPRGVGYPFAATNFRVKPRRAHKSFRIRSYEKRTRNPFRIRSYKIPRGVEGSFALSLRASALSASQRYPFLPSSFPSHLAPPRPRFDSNCRLSTSTTQC